MSFLTPRVNDPRPQVAPGVRLDPENNFHQKFLFQNGF